MPCVILLNISRMGIYNNKQDSLSSFESRSIMKKPLLSSTSRKLKEQFTFFSSSWLLGYLDMIQLH